MVVTLNGYWGSDMYCCGCGTVFNEDGFRAPAKTDAAKTAMEIHRVKELWRGVTMTRKEAYRADFAKIDEFEEAVSNMQIPQGGPKPLVCGDYLIELGLTPGPAFKTILDDVYEMQLEGEITTEWEAHERVHFFVNEWALN
jgi:hypothetical protein